MPPSNDAASPLATLQCLLATARGLVDELADDALGVRLKRAFATFPPGDRETILGVLEREATWCRIVAQTSGTTGITVRPNPHASLYLHVFREIAPSARDLEVIRVGMDRFLQIVPLLFQEGVHAQWTAAARALIRATDPTVRDLCARLAREVLALIESESGATPADGTRG